MTSQPTAPQLDALRQSLPRLLGNVDEATFEVIRPHLIWTFVELAGGKALFREGEPSDALYVLLSGRLEATVTGADGLPQAVGEIGRGESVGEMGVFSGESRRATVSALRDSLLARIELSAVHAILKAAPELALNVNRIIIERLQRRNTSHKPPRNVTNVAIVSITEGSAPCALVQRLSVELQSHGRTVTHLTSESIDAAAGRAGAAQAPDEDSDGHYWLVKYLDDLEERCSLVFYEADAGPSEWTRRCLRQADEVLLVARATASPELSPIERAYLDGKTTRAQQKLVLLQSADATWPDGTLPFLARRPNVQRHYHLRTDNKADLGRLARFLSGNAVGLVFPGGGARGLVHIGIFRALVEAGVPIDFFGGTSVGSVLAACMACDWGWEKVYSENKREFLSNPTSDFNLIPLVSLLAGRKLERILHASFANRHIEEMWIPFLCVSSNYTRASEEVHTRGEIKPALLASMAIPGIFPPVVIGRNLHVDGGVFNNMPVDVMARTGVKTIIAVDLRPQENERRALAIERVPDPWTLFIDRLRPRASRRYHQIPLMLTTLMAANTLTSEEKTAQVIVDADLLFNPDVRRFGWLDWKSYDLLVDEGYQHARAVLGKRPLPF